MYRMFEIIVKIWYIVAVLPFLIFIEGSKKFGNFLKRKNVYKHWDIWHAYLVVLLIILAILWMNGYR